MNVETLLKKLIEIESVSGNESKLGEFVCSILEPFFQVNKVFVEGERFNIVAKSGKPKIWLNTHLDTVPIGNNKLREDESYIYGRGSCDAKGSMAAMICAAINLRKQVKTNFGLFFDIAEETDFAGIKAGLPEDSPNFVVIGEPTNLVPAIGQKGFLSFTLTAKGKKAHGSRPEEGICAITKISEAVLKLKSMEFPECNVLGKTAVNVGLINGGCATNVVPDSAELSCEIRTVKDNSFYISIIKKGFPDFELNIVDDFSLVLIKEKSVIDFAEKLTGNKSEVKGAFTELYFWPSGIILGPGSIEQAHKDNEFVEKKQLATAVKLYEQFVLQYAG